MANLTLSIDGEVLKRARIKALGEGTSVNALVRQYLGAFAGDDALERQRRATQALLALSEQSEAGSGPEGRTWTREELYEERIPQYLRRKSERS